MTQCRHIYNLVIWEFKNSRLEKNMKKHNYIYICMYNQITLLYTRN